MLVDILYLGLGIIVGLLITYFVAKVQAAQERIDLQKEREQEEKRLWDLAWMMYPVDNIIPVKENSALFEENYQKQIKVVNSGLKKWDVKYLYGKNALN